ncbi:MAG: hypothetical protein L6R39_000604 [Caloplaca ligustica]|nr:MAG: hypothetical protein L6R39_000604 [Caloplaca ligustica]
MAEGWLRTIRSEQAAARIVLLDIDHAETPEDIDRAITSKLGTANTKDSGLDTEFWLSRSVLHISRVYPHTGFNQNESEAQERLLPRELSLKAGTVDGQLTFAPRTQRPRLSEGEVEAEIHASELQRSISASQQLVCGTLIRVVSSVNRSRVGRRIVTLSYDGLETTVYTSAYAALGEDEHAPPETILSTLLPLNPIIDLCLFRNKMAEGDFLLSLLSPKPLMTTVARLAKTQGWEISFVVNSREEKEEYVSQLGLGPEQVLLSEHVESILSLTREQSKPSGSMTRLSRVTTMMEVESRVLRRLRPKPGKWMNERGAKHFAFISRSGTDKPEAARLVESLQKAGATTQVFRADVSNDEAVRRVVNEIKSKGQIRGVVHAATAFKHMDHAPSVECAEAKAQGVLSLHHAVLDLNLDFFAMTSSISALLGNTGQSNYSAANSVLDALAVQRRANNLAATSLVLPMVLDVGVMAENEAIETSLARKGLYGIDEVEMLRGFEVAMSRPSSIDPDKTMDSQIIMGLEARELARSISSTENVDAYRYNDPPKHIAKRMSSILMIPADEVELDGPSLGSYGLDSMIGAEKRTWNIKEFGLDYPLQKLLAPTLTVNRLAGVVAEKTELNSTAQ